MWGINKRGNRFYELESELKWDWGAAHPGEGRVVGVTAAVAKRKARVVGNG